MINLANQLLFTEEKNAIYELIEAIFKEHDYCKEIIKKCFKKNLIMSVEDEERLQSSNKCWICNKLFAEEDKKVRDHDHITGKYRGPAHSSCNINLKAPAIFHNLRGYVGHLIMKEIMLQK